MGGASRGMLVVGLAVACGGTPPSLPDNASLGPGTGGASTGGATDTDAFSTSADGAGPTGGPGTTVDDGADLTDTGPTDPPVDCDGADDLCHGAQPEVLLDGGAYGLALADMNQDGALDAAMGTWGGLGVYLLPGDGHGGFQGETWTSVEVADGYLEDAIVLDYDADGMLDVAVAISGDPSMPEVIALLRGQGDGTVVLDDQIDVTGLGPWELAAGDFDADARTDLAVVFHVAGELRVWLGAGASFGPVVSTGVGLPLGGISVANLDGDGQPDLVLTVNEPGTVPLLQGTGAGEFVVVDVLDTAGAPWDAEAVDLDGDANPDLVVLDDGLGLGVWPGTGAFSFADPQWYDLAPGAEDLAVADVNADGRLDVVVCHSGFLGVSILVGRGDGTLAAPVEFASSREMYSVAVGDLDADGVGDVVAVGDEDPASVFVVLSHASG